MHEISDEFTTSYDDVIRFTSADDFAAFLYGAWLNMTEVMPLGYSTKEAPDVYLPAEECPLIRPDMVTGTLLLQWRTG